LDGHRSSDDQDPSREGGLQVNDQKMVRYQLLPLFSRGGIHTLEEAASYMNELVTPEEAIRHYNRIRRRQSGTVVSLDYAMRRGRKDIARRYLLGMVSDGWLDRSENGDPDNTGYLMAPEGFGRIRKNRIVVDKILQALRVRVTSLSTYSPQAPEEFSYTSIVPAELATLLEVLAQTIRQKKEENPTFPSLGGMREALHLLAGRCWMEPPFVVIDQKVLSPRDKDQNEG